MVSSRREERRVPLPWKRLLLAAWLIAGCLLLPACGSMDETSLGGNIEGKVLTWSSHGGTIPVAGAYVVARHATEGILRSTYTDEYGNFYFSGLRTGTWNIGVSALGYASIDVYKGEITAWCEPGRTYRVGEIYLYPQASSGTGKVDLLLLDEYTGDPIAFATVLVGPAAGSTDYSGRCLLDVPVTVDPYTGQPQAQAITVSASGYDPATVTPSSVTPVAGQTIYVTVTMRRSGVTLTGTLRASSYHQLYASYGAYQYVTISSDTIPSPQLDAYIDPATGYFSVKVPAGSTGFNLRFTSPYFHDKTVGPITVSQGGGTLSSIVYLDPVTRDVVGRAQTSYGVPLDTYDQVVIEELGVSTVCFSGSFSFNSVPTGLPLTFRATRTSTYETGAVVSTITANPYGASYPPFDLGTIIVR